MSVLVNKILSTEKSFVHQIFETKGKVYTYLNPVSYLTALDNKELFGKMDGIFADGGLLVKAIKLVYGKQVTRRSFDMTSRHRSCSRMQRSMEMDDEAKHIVKLNSDFLIVGMGALMQEKFLLKVKNAGYQGVGFTCGGFIHQTSRNEIDYYPAWVDKTNLRFVYRMWKEPHTRKRYVMAGLLFPARFIAEKIFG